MIEDEDSGVSGAERTASDEPGWDDPDPQPAPKPNLAEEVAGFGDTVRAILSL